MSPGARLRSNGDMVYRLRASDGSRLWNFPTNDSVTSGITLAGGVVYAGSNDGKVYALNGN